MWRIRKYRKRKMRKYEMDVRKSEREGVRENERKGVIRGRREFGCYKEEKYLREVKKKWKRERN
jgi:hypothetical protein